MLTHSRSKQAISSSKPSVPKVAKPTYSYIQPVPLSWLDFQGEADKCSRYHAHCYWNISYTYIIYHYDGYVKAKVNVKCTFDKKRSWTKQQHQNNELLRHEQGHYEIGCLCANEFKKRVEEKRLSKSSFRKEITDTFRDTLNEYLKYEKLYDEETNHYKNKTLQKQWENKLVRQLNDYNKSQTIEY